MIARLDHRGCWYLSSLSVNFCRSIRSIFYNLLGCLASSSAFEYSAISKRLLFISWSVIALALTAHMLNEQPNMISATFKASSGQSHCLHGQAIFDNAQDCHGPEIVFIRSRCRSLRCRIDDCNCLEVRVDSIIVSKVS